MWCAARYSRDLPFAERASKKAREKEGEQKHGEDRELDQEVNAVGAVPRLRNRTGVNTHANTPTHLHTQASTAFSVC